MNIFVRWYNQAYRAWRWRQIKRLRLQMHALLRQWEIWKQQFVGRQMIANDYYFHNLDIIVKRCDFLFRKIRKHKLA